jgi:hypothetical protein
MATVYLWSGAGGAGDGTSFTDAYTSWSAMVTGEGAGSMDNDIIYMAKDHQESGASFSLADTGSGFTTRPRVYSMNRTGPVYDPQTTSYNFKATSGDITWAATDYVDWYGVYFEATDGLLSLGTVYTMFQDCTFHISAATSAKYVTNLDSIHAISCTFKDSSNAYHVSYYLDSGSTFEVLVDSVYESLETSTTSNTGLLRVHPRGQVLGGKVTTSNSNASAFTNAGRVCHVETDVPFSSLIDSGGGFDLHAELYAVDNSGASYGRDWMTGIGHEFLGDVQPTTALYRSGGWVDTPSNTPLSWKCSPRGSVVDVNYRWLRTAPISGRLDTTGSKTFTAYCLHTYTNLYTSDFGFWLFYQGTANSVRWHYVSTLEDDPESATTALTADTSTWTGRTTETRFKLSKTVTINTPGEWMMLFVARSYESGKFIWICPKVEIT